MREDLIKELQEQEASLIFTSFSRDNALELGNMIVQTAKQKQVVIAVEIILNDLPVFKHSMEGTTLRHDMWLKRKANTVKFSQGSSLLFGQLLAETGKPLDTGLYLSFQDYTVLGGGFPLKIDGVGTVGSISVSGLPDVEDHGIIVEVLTKYLKK